ncbi:DNA methyltransferase [Hyphomicrobium nitrativorans NL23]|uniref:site-specific DNA-methyltransferase (adenine-specific) n=1 Tax=Hyphomicrobium nitrativorans NL23 TaxID=1029756 RepID=V5SD31_9HYPH|nr:DNA methyltransferase [Hyphomicrobium nitrativorans]AHB47854.1 DNA methyltransferase [Hyphomicrobium nitrativorans NL23]
MSRLTDLIAQVKAKDPATGAELEREFQVLSSRRAFGLNFERHRPEAVELPQRKIRKGDKVRILPPRGSTKKGEQRLWLVKSLSGRGESKSATLDLIGGGEPETQSVAVVDLVVVAEFRDVIYPGLVSTGKVERGGDRPYHTVINGENFHVLKALTYSHRGKIDAIYIDPPYNSGAQDWKYNNNYVEKDDLYRHSKWLAMMERRLRVARELLNPLNSVLIVAIDDKEFARLALLLEQTFPDARQEMITTVINPRGKYRQGEFARCEEYIFFLAFGAAKVLGEPDGDFAAGSTVSWRTLRRSDLSSARGTKKGGTSQFYPIYIGGSGRIERIGEALDHAVDRKTAPQLPGCVAVFPIRDDGTEMNWGLTGPSLKSLLDNGYVRVGRATPDRPQQYEVSYLTSGRIADIESGRAKVVGRAEDGSVIAKYETSKIKMPVSTWARPSHNAEIYGTDLLKALIGDRTFPFPKSLHAVEDCLRLFIADKPEAIVLDFFSGSGTTAHAVMRLNRQDGGRRQCISVTNNEVAAEEQAALRKKKLRPGDIDWEKWGICEYITKPRIAAAITGKSPDGKEIEGDYKFTDEFQIAEGFDENAEFFTLTYETPVSVSHNKAFARIAPLLWMRAGSEGRRIDALPAKGWEVADTYGLLTDLDKAAPFCKAIASEDAVRIAYIVTDDDRRFQSVARRLPVTVEPVRLYESYLSNFQFTNGE